MTKGHTAALETLDAASIGGSWFAAKTSAFAMASATASSSGVAWTMIKGHAFALVSREAASTGYAWTAARTRTLARASSEASSHSLSWTLAKGHAFARATLDAASMFSAWTAARTRTLAGASLSAALTGGSWMRTTSGDLVLKLHHAASKGVPWIQAAGQSGADKPMALRAAARATARLQSERASLFALRMTAQTKGDIDALRRAARAGAFASPAWRKVVSIASTQGFVSRFDAEEKPKEPMAACEASGADDAISRKGEHSSSKALICVEPWRCRLPVVQTDGPARFGHKAGRLEGSL
jgi:hypothetical protein